MFRIIEVCGASMQQSLQDLDNTTAEGTKAIDTLIEVCKTLVDHGSEATWLTSSEKNIKAAKRYFKTEFKSHIGREETCADHCTTHALSEPLVTPTGTEHVSTNITSTVRNASPLRNFSRKLNLR